ncbi:hypothetical protein DYB25_007876 [Aphanomyces astaci]|uniref:DUS-like FMN-binding domain-containing protein n=2 Tax=Aphanomyces astaci TaxID=112090 RepID=A0A397DY50_APHAT|nr:hypothetical protein DYB25_007876 [Aphanomyces astaci]RHY73196.1 hypothetical protein DYB30_007275 [Aphanomyces astaci]
MSTEYAPTRLSVAPMMDWTDRHYRYMMRLITRRTLLYTEMVVDATVCDSYGSFHEININVGCPSPKVSKNCFGARLMLDPAHVRDICHEMRRQVTSTPITVKCRLGVDDFDSYDPRVNPPFSTELTDMVLGRYEYLHEFVATVQTSGVTEFTVHARKCWLDGLRLSPHENRTVPALNYDFVGRLKADFPHLRIMLNGGVSSIQHAHKLLQDPSLQVDGIMIGRAAYNTPWNFRDADRLHFGVPNPGRRTFPEHSQMIRSWLARVGLSRRQVVAAYLDYADDMQAKWGSVRKPGQYAMPTSLLMKPLLNLGEFGGKAVKRHVAQRWADRQGEQLELRDLVETAMEECIPAAVLDATCDDDGDIVD